MIQPGSEAVAGARGPMPDFMVVPLNGLDLEGVQAVERTLASLGLTALCGKAAADFIASREATNVSETEIDSDVQYASYKSFEDFGRVHGYRDSTPFRVWSRLSYAGEHYPNRETAERAPNYNDLQISPRQLVNEVRTYLRIVDYSPEGRAVEEIDLNGLYVFLKVLLQNGYKKINTGFTNSRTWRNKLQHTGTFRK